jgi:hypothetical protein
MLPVYRNVEPEKFDEGGVIPKAKKGGQVLGVVLGWVNGGEFAFSEDVAVDATGDIWEFGNATRQLEEADVRRAMTNRSMQSS